MKKLALKRTTLRNLTGRDLDFVIGGAGSSDCITAGCTRDNCPDPTPTAGCTTVGGPTDVCTQIGCR
jgi:hypothetical protein